jgi:uncharacterized protein YutD
VTKPLVNALIAGIDARFASIVNDEDYQVATALIPQFKLNFLDDETQKLELKRKVLAFVEAVAQEQNAEGCHIFIVDFFNW